MKGQILDISVANLYDNHFNKQLSPLSFTAYVNRQDVNWFTKEGNQSIDADKLVGETYTFEMDLVNKGGNIRSYQIQGLPSWLSVEQCLR